jgi:hypothetical protein
LRLKVFHTFKAFLGFLLLIDLNPSTAYAHKDHTHAKPAPALNDEKVPVKEAGIEADAVLRTIGASYSSSIETIFRRTCFDCHSSETRYPWYSKLPFANSLIEGDIEEAKKHLDMSEGFPFKGHGSVPEDLTAIEEAVRDGSMPPLRYRVLHPGSSLTQVERERVKNWVEESLKLLKK